MKQVRHKGVVWQVLGEVMTADNGRVLNLYRTDPTSGMHWTAAKAVECVEVEAGQEAEASGS